MFMPEPKTGKDPLWQAYQNNQLSYIFHVLKG